MSGPISDQVCVGGACPGTKPLRVRDFFFTRKKGWCPITPRIPHGPRHKPVDQCCALTGQTYMPDPLPWLPSSACSTGARGGCPNVNGVCGCNRPESQFRSLDWCGRQAYGGCSATDPCASTPCVDFTLEPCKVDDACDECNNCSSSSDTCCVCACDGDESECCCSECDDDADEQYARANQIDWPRDVARHPEHTYRSDDDDDACKRCPKYECPPPDKCANAGIASPACGVNREARWARERRAFRPSQSVRAGPGPARPVSATIDGASPFATARFTAGQSRARERVARGPSRFQGGSTFCSTTTTCRIRGGMGPREIRTAVCSSAACTGANCALTARVPQR